MSLQSCRSNQPSIVAVFWVNLLLRLLCCVAAARHTAVSSMRSASPALAASVLAGQPTAACLPHWSRPTCLHCQCLDLQTKADLECCAAALQPLSVTHQSRLGLHRSKQDHSQQTKRTLASRGQRYPPWGTHRGCCTG